MNKALADALSVYRGCLERRDTEGHEAAARRLRREMLRCDPYYPSYHFCAPEGRIGDPNGVIYAEGAYHLFYQHRPVIGGVQLPTCWGHAHSADLVRWHDDPLALYPDTPFDRNGCYSGNIIADGNGGYAALYTGNIDEHAECYGMLARSTDGLRTWTKKMVLHDRRRPHPDTPVNWDNCLWREKGRWCLLSGGCENGRGAAYLWTSPDLANWSCEGNIAPSIHWGEFWELPYLFELDGRHVLLTGYGNACFIGTWDADARRFVAQSGPYCLDAGHYYSFNAHLRDELHGGRRILHGWVTGIPTPAPDVPWWQGMHAIPRVLTIRDDVPWLEPIPEMESLCGEALEVDAKSGCEAPDAFVAEAVFDTDADEAGLMLFENRERTQGVRIRYLRNEQSIVIGGETIRQNREAYASAGWEQLCSVLSVRQKLPIPVSGALRIRVYADRSVVEVYCGGAACTARCFPQRDARRIRVLDPDAKLKGILVKPIKGIWI